MAWLKLLLKIPGALASIAGALKWAVEQYKKAGAEKQHAQNQADIDAAFRGVPSVGGDGVRESVEAGGDKPRAAVDGQPGVSGSAGIAGAGQDVGEGRADDNQQSATATGDGQH
jgi:hypothetical protein